MVRRSPSLPKIGSSLTLELAIYCAEGSESRARPTPHQADSGGAPAKGYNGPSGALQPSARPTHAMQSDIGVHQHHRRQQSPKIDIAAQRFPAKEQRLRLCREEPRCPRTQLT